MKITNRIILCAVVSLFSLQAFAGKEKPNVLFIAIDDLRPEVGTYGAKDVLTPNIDRLAREGLRFDNAYCQYPVCNPSRASFLTGLRPDELGIVTNRIALREKWPDIVTLPQLFRQNGYYTAGLGKLFHMGLDEAGEQTLFRDDKSFDYGYRALGRNPKIGNTGERRMLGDGSIKWAQWLAAEGGDAAQPDGMLAEEAVRILQENKDGPFFIGVGFHKPHDPFFAPKEYFEHYPLAEVKLPDEPKDKSKRLKSAIPWTSWDFSSFEERDQKEFIRAYHACTTFADAQVGKLFAVMDEHDLWDNTIVILLGDHGYHLGEHDWWNKVTVYELGARGPFMMWVPGAKGMGSTTSSVVEYLDLFPTLIDYCGLDAPHELSGKSMRPVIENPAKDWNQPAYTQVVRPEVKMGYSVRFGKWRYTQWGANGEGGYELYDQSKDHDGYYNLADSPEYTSVRKKLDALLSEGYPGIE